MEVLATKRNAATASAGAAPTRVPVVCSNAVDPPLGDNQMIVACDACVSGDPLTKLEA